MSAVVASPKLEITNAVYLNTRYPCIAVERRQGMSNPDRPETAGIADQLRRAFYGDAWHGDSLFEILDGVTAAQASARPVKSAHSIWELVLHVAAWDGAVRRRMTGVALELAGETNFPPVTDTSDESWRKALAHL